MGRPGRNKTKYKINVYKRLDDGEVKINQKKTSTQRREFRPHVEIY